MITKTIIIMNINKIAVNKWLTRLTNKIVNNNKSVNHLLTTATTIKSVV